MLRITKKELRYYIKPNGKAPFAEWLNNKIRDNIIRSRIERRLERMEQGYYGDYKALGDGVYELRLGFGSGYRVYFAEQHEVIIILLCGGNKTTQTKDINNAKRYWRELREQQQ